MNIKIRKKGSYPDAMIASVLAVLFSHKFPRAKKPYLEKDVCVCMYEEPQDDEEEIFLTFSFLSNVFCFRNYKSIFSLSYNT
jgi:hypothetical protein